MDDGLPLFRILVYFLFIVIDLVFFGFGAAIQNINATELERKMEAGDRKAAQILRIMNRPGRFVNTIQITAVLTGFATGGILTGCFVQRLAGELLLPGGAAASYIVSTVLLYLLCLTVLVSFGAVAPKRLAERKPEAWAYRTVGVVRFFMTLLMPVYLPVHYLSRLILKICGVDLNAHGENVTEEDIMSMVNEGHEQGVVESSEAEMITNIFELNDKNAADVMTHRKSMVGLNGGMTLAEACDFMLTEGSNSRYPVYENDIDNIIGTLNMKDALICSHQGEMQDRKLCEIPGLLRETHFIPETCALDTLFREMQSGKIHMEIVVDEYGQTSGLVTMEDILEEIVGNIMDEYDEDEEMITPLKNGSWIAKGLIPLEDLKDDCGIGFTEDELDSFDTLNGYLIAQLDRIPADGEQFTAESHGFEFRVLHVQNKLIRSVKITRRETAAGTETDGGRTERKSGQA